MKPLGVSWCFFPIRIYIYTYTLKPIGDIGVSIKLRYPKPLVWLMNVMMRDDQFWMFLGSAILRPSHILSIRNWWWNMNISIHTVYTTILQYIYIYYDIKSHRPFLTCMEMWPFSSHLPDGRALGPWWVRGGKAVSILFSLLIGWEVLPEGSLAPKPSGRPSGKLT